MFKVKRSKERIDYMCDTEGLTIEGLVNDSWEVVPCILYQLIDTIQARLQGIIKFVHQAAEIRRRRQTLTLQDGQTQHGYQQHLR